MKVEFQKWGDSLALRVPKALADQIGAAEGKRAEMTAENGVLVIRVVKSRKRRRFDLEDLINGITEQNRHPETEWGPPAGNEAW